MPGSVFASQASITSSAVTLPGERRRTSAKQAMDRFFRERRIETTGWFDLIDAF